MDGPGGTGKTFVYNTLARIVRGQQRRVVMVASTGIAATLLPGGRTAHACFHIKGPLHDNSSCCPKLGTREAGTLRIADLIIWDEASMAHAYAIQAVDKGLKDLMNNWSMPFGGKVVVLGGDFRQTLPVVRGGTESETVAASIKRSRLWQEFRQLRLTENMRAGLREHEFAEWLLQLGEGRLGSDGQVEVPPECISQGNLIDETFASALQDPRALAGCAILAPTNEQALTINDKVLRLLHGEERVYLSVDRVECDDESEANTYPLEFLHDQTPTSMPPHKLCLKVGAVVVILRNLSLQQGLCNGTRLKVTALYPNVIMGEILTGERVGERVLLPKIDLYTSDDDHVPFRLHRRQFPVRLGFAMTINKSQGQTFDKVGFTCLNLSFHMVSSTLVCPASAPLTT